VAKCDLAIFDMHGNQWGKMTPITPILNPVMEEPARNPAQPQAEGVAGDHSGRSGPTASTARASRPSLCDIRHQPQ